MTGTERVKAFVELYELVDYYYKNRDRPINDGINFFSEVEQYCKQLDLDFKEFKKEFELI